MTVTAAAEIDLLPTYTSRWALKFLASRVLTTVVITMLLTMGVFTAIQLSVPVSVAMAVSITIFRVSSEIREFKQNEIWTKTIFGGVLFIFIPKQRHNVRTQMTADTVMPHIEDVESMISFAFPGYGWTKREPILAVQKTRISDMNYTPPSNILIAGLFFVA